MRGYHQQPLPKSNRLNVNSNMQLNKLLLLFVFYVDGMTITVDGVEGRPLYLDAQATTPLDPRVLDAMLPYLTSFYGNPHSRTHAYGWESEKAVETARAVSIYLTPFSGLHIPNFSQLQATTND